MLVSCLAHSSTFKIEGDVSPKRWLTSNGIHGVISLKTELYSIIYSYLRLYLLIVSLRDLWYSTRMFFGASSFQYIHYLILQRSEVL
jgi:hypothetical protein